MAGTDGWYRWLNAGHVAGTGGGGEAGIGAWWLGMHGIDTKKSAISSQEHPASLLHACINFTAPIIIRVVKWLVLIVVKLICVLICFVDVYNSLTQKLLSPFLPFQLPHASFMIRNLLVTYVTVYVAIDIIISLGVKTRLRFSGVRSRPLIDYNVPSIMT